MKRMKKITLFLFSIFSLIIILESPIANANETNVIDLSEYENIDDFYVKLNGEWIFFEEEFLTPQESVKRLENGDGKAVSIPNSFASQGGKINTYGTYSTKIKVSKDFVGKTLAIHVPYQYSAYTLYSDDVEIGRNGAVGTSEETHVSEMSPRSGYFKVTDDEFVLTMQISNFNYTVGGFQKSIYLGESYTVTKKASIKMATTLFLNGSILIIGLFMFFFALYRGQERLFGAFGLFAILIAVRSLFIDPYYYTLFLPAIPWKLGIKLEFLLTEAAGMTFIMLLWYWYNKVFPKIVLNILIAIIVVLMIITIFTEPLIFQPLFFNVFYLSIPIFLYSVYTIFRNIRSYNRNAKMNLIGIGIVFAALINDFAIANEWYDFVLLILPAVGIYVFIHFVFMSKGFADTIKKTEDLNTRLFTLNQSLDNRIQERTAQLQKVNDDLKQLALTDGLTGIYNRRSFDEYVEKEFEKAKLRQRSLSILMLDLDYFKKYNDHFGHVEGDKLLKELVAIIARDLPQNSFFARYGGEEFVIVLPNMEDKEAYDVAELIRIAVEEARLVHPTSVLGVVTFSAGVATMTDDTTYKTATELIDAADRRLYEAKQNGRNQVA